jgi:hypothetical protein
MTYQDVLSAPTYERRFFLDLLVSENERKLEKMEEQRQQIMSSSGKGTRTTKIGGEQLKSKLKNGEIPG